jgi:hypothetical protein
MVFLFLEEQHWALNGLYTGRYLILFKFMRYRLVSFLRKSSYISPFPCDIVSCCEIRECPTLKS